MMRSMTSHQPIWLNHDEPPPPKCRGGSIAVGNFDGVHLGHAHLVRTLRDKGRPDVVLSFDPHPLCLLAPERFQPLLTTTKDRAEYLCDVGADAVVLLRTTRELLQLSATEFFERILSNGFRPKVIVEGFNFRFGRDRHGDLEMLERLCRSSRIELVRVPPLELDGAPVSSSRVRNALLAGDVTEAARLMGRFYCLGGIVGVGQRRGRGLGFPTANLERVETLIPGDGVYAVRVRFEEASWAGAANVGANPTFGESVRKIEVHLIDFTGDLYGKPLAVEFIKRIRDTRPFAGPEDLKVQLTVDIARARAVVQETASCPIKT
jgi:riboflavin kinase / FMN adenylyltransferase